MDPFTILAIARGAVSAIKQGCQLYNEFKGEIVQAKKTVEQAQTIIKEVGGFFGFFKRKVEVPVEQAAAPKKEKRERVEFDEGKVKKDIADNLVTFFKAVEQLKQHIHESEQKSREVYDPDQNVMEAALHRVMALDEMEKLQYEIRQIMVYETPGMGDLYSRVIKMVGVISEEQAIARMEKERRERDEKWRRKQMENDLHNKMLYAMAVGLVVGYVALMWWVLTLDRKVRWGF